MEEDHHPEGDAANRSSDSAAPRKRAADPTEQPPTPPHKLPKHPAAAALKASAAAANCTTIPPLSEIFALLDSDGVDLLGEVPTAVVRQLLRLAEINAETALLEAAFEREREQLSSHAPSSSDFSSSGPSSHPSTSSASSQSAPPLNPLFSAPPALRSHIVGAAQTAAHRAKAAPPRHVHWSVKDSAPQVQLHDDGSKASGGLSSYAAFAAGPREAGGGSAVKAANSGGGKAGARALDGLTGGQCSELLDVSSPKGYRMSRASHGASAGCFYYEVEILCCGDDSAVAATSPIPAATAGDRGDSDAALASASTYAPAVRVGFSMRTAELQAPVGYDKWSYAYRSVGGSRVHKSERDDDWGGEPFKTGDVIGCALCLAGDADQGIGKDAAAIAAAGATHPPGGSGADDCFPSTSHIRFFRNGHPMGKVVVNRGKYEGGEAFDPISPGVYYPAVSGYMGGRVRANFGPKFLYPPTGVPAGLRFKPFSDLGGGWRDVDALEQQLKTIVGKVDLTPPQVNKGKFVATRNKGKGGKVERDEGPFKNLDAIVAKIVEIVTARIENMRLAAHLEYVDGVMIAKKSKK